MRAGLLVVTVAMAAVLPGAAVAGSHRDDVSRQCAAAASSAIPVPPVGVSRCPEVRPGVFVSSRIAESRSFCTLGFLYRDKRGTVYASTGADCAAPFVFEPGVRTWPKGKGPVALDEGERRIGEFAFRFDVGAVSMSLIRVDPGVRVNPQVCHYGGPTGLVTSVDTVPRPVVVVGPEGNLHSLSVAGVTAGGSVSRPGFAHRGLDSLESVVVMAQSLSEEGMPVVDVEGRVIGTAGALLEFRGFAGDFGMHVDRPMIPIRAAEQALRTTLTLMTAPLL